MNSTSDSLLLKQAHAQAVSEVNIQVEHWTKVKNDYNQLSERLSTLPDKTFHNIMVPFGSLAFMPGKLIHTNELLVHLGDSWFADVSCKEGLKIIDHRLQAVDKNLDDLNKVLKNMEKKKDYADELDNTGDQPAYEIKEEVPPSYVHPGKRKRISRVESKTAEVKQRSHEKTSTLSEDKVFKSVNDEELMKRLDELEREEEEQDQIILNEAGDAQSMEKSTADNESTLFRNKSGKKVSWKEKIVEGREADSDDSDDTTPVCATISFRHTTSVEQRDSERLSSGDHFKSAIKSPGDIGRCAPPKATFSTSFQEIVVGKGETSVTDKKANAKVVQNPKSILKTTTYAGSERPTTSRKPGAPKLPVPVSESVLERSAQDFVKHEEKQASKKPVSKFKASRKR